MNPSVLRAIGTILLMSAVVVAILNLHRVADLRMPWLAPLFMIFGVAFLVIARKRAQVGS